jgi:hypothetical protein
MARGVVTVQHLGDPLWPAVVVDEPDMVSDYVPDQYPVVWRASGEGPMTATIRAFNPDQAGAPGELIASDVPMLVDPAGGFWGCFEWDVHLLPNNTYYYVLVEVRDAAGRTHESFSPGSLLIARDGAVTDAGVPRGCPAGPVGPGADAGAGGDGGMTGFDDSAPLCGCRASGGRAAFPLWLAGIAVAALAARRASRRRR